MSIQYKAVHGILWSAIEKFGIQFIQFILGIILARLLDPSDYGIIGMLLIFLSLSEALIDSGFSSALIRLKYPTQEDYSTVFWFNIIISSFLYIIIYLSSPIIADFYNQPLLTDITRIYMLVLVINAFSSIQRVILTKEIDFKRQTKITLTSTFIGGVIGIFAALNEMGVYALVIQSLARSMISALLFWIIGKWVPSIIFSIKSFRQSFNYGSKILIAAISNVISENLYSVLIGKIYTSSSLGYYTRALQFKQLTISSTYGIMRRVSFPILTQIQDNDFKLRQAYSKFIKLIAFTLFPIIGLMVTLSDSIIIVFLGNKWIESAELLRIISFAGITYPLSSINLNVLNVKGRSDLYLKMELLKNFFSIITLALTYKYSLESMLWGQVIVSLISYYVNSIFVKRLIGYGFLSQIQNLGKPILITIITIIVIFITADLLINHIHKLIVGTLLGSIVYLILFWYIAKEDRDDYVLHFKALVR